MRNLTIDGFLLCVMACAACTGDSSSGSPTGGGTVTDPFVGTWGCSETMSLVFTSPPGASPFEHMETATIRITGSGGMLTASKVTDGGDPGCSVSITSSGSSASLGDGQTCTTKLGVTLTYKSGSATVSGSSLNSTYEFDATGMASIGGVMVDATATGTQKATCSRISAPPSTSGGATTGGGW
jgi:hypothetical protein